MYRRAWCCTTCNLCIILFKCASTVTCALYNRNYMITGIINSVYEHLSRSSIKLSYFSIKSYFASGIYLKLSWPFIGSFGWAYTIVNCPSCVVGTCWHRHCCLWTVLLHTGLITETSYACTCTCYIFKMAAIFFFFFICLSSQHG